MSSSWNRSIAHPLVGAIALPLAGVLVLSVSRPVDTPTSELDAAPDVEPDVVPWCAPGLEPIAGGGCLSTASVDAGEPLLLVYLHGMYSPSTVDEELDRQTRVARIARQKGVSVLALRGRQGLCTGADTASFWCWPSNGRTAGFGREVVDGWSKALTVTDTRLGHGRRYLLGFSNGGYFAALIATRGLARFDAFAVAHAGPVEPLRASGPRVPWLLLMAEGDPSAASMQTLDDELWEQAWPHEIVSRDGGHQLTDGDIEAALAFFARVRPPPPEATVADDVDGEP